MFWQIFIVSVFLCIRIDCSNSRYRSDNVKKAGGAEISIVAEKHRSNISLRVIDTGSELSPFNISHQVLRSFKIVEHEDIGGVEIIPVDNRSMVDDTMAAPKNNVLRTHHPGIWGQSVNESWMNDLAELGYDVKCKMQPNSYDCSTWQNKTVIPRYYYDIRMQSCLTFDYYECYLSMNNFLTLFECNEHCRNPGLQPVNIQNPNIFCRFQPDFGNCHHYHPMYYFDITTRTCIGFSYSGCGGNMNRFHTAQSCVAICSPRLGQMD